jgi:N-acetylmuramic acid 6-phosphate etherase
VNDDLFEELMDHPYLAQQPPKTTGREVFGAHMGEQIWQRGRALGLSGEDIIATLTLFTAASIARAHRDWLPRLPDEVIVSGGGARNTTLLRFLQEQLQPARVMLSDELGIAVEAKEAVAFAVLAYETWHGRPGNLPGATGAAHPVVLGSITSGSHRISEVEAAPSTQLLTEAINPATMQIDALSTKDVVQSINVEDQRVAEAVATQSETVAQAIDAIAQRMREGGRLIYVGAGTSGRLGVLDASELPPTFSLPPDRVVGVIAGGSAAIARSIEGAEDDAEQGRRDVANLNVSSSDCVIGIAASGRTPYVLGALAEARARGALTISLVCNADTPMHRVADIVIAPLVGPEVISGSTRMKAGTATKMVLNTISTGVMIKLGKTFGNLMVDVQPNNSKLRDRARRIVEHACGVSAEDAAALLAQCDSEVKTAIVARLAAVSPDQARERLKRTGGVVREAIREAT